MAGKKGLCRDRRGLFVRNLGYKRTAKGYGQQKFYLGRDEAKAKIANLKLEQLWQAVCQRWERLTFEVPRLKPGQSSQRLVQQLPNPVTGKPMSSAVSGAVLMVGPQELEYVREGRPTWDELTLAIADAIRKGDSVARVSLPDKLAAKGFADPSVGQWLSQLRDDVGVIHIELVDRGLQKEAERELDEQADELVERARRLRRRHGGGETLHAGLRAHSDWVDKTYVGMDGRPEAWGRAQKRQIDFLLRYLPDCALVELDAQRIDELLNVLRLRPVLGSGKHASVAWTRNCIKQFRSFLRWLNKCPDFSWKRPPDYETTAIRIPRTPQEKAAAARPSQVDTYTTDELQTLFEYASPLQRVFMLLALNCAFGRAELASLEMKEVHLHNRHPYEREVGYTSKDEDSWIFRVRQKTGVYGEYKLWPETAIAIDWWLRQRSEITTSPQVTTLLVTRKGNRYDTPTKGNHTNFQLPNSWYNLTKRIQNDHKDFRKLSFNKLRKTAGNLVRQEAGGEIAGVFLCHGSPVPSDKLVDLYSDRPFAKLFDAIDMVGVRLRSVWSSVKEPFPMVRKKGGPNISHNTIRKIQRMRQAGFKVAQVAKEVGVDKNTVYRWGKQSAKGTNARKPRPRQSARQ